MSQLLDRLDEKLRLETNPMIRAELLAQKAGYLARIGRFEEGRAIISDVRGGFGDVRDGRVTVQVMLAEGLLLQFELLAAGAGDRFMRAHFLAQTMKDQELIAISSAWRAHLAFEASDWVLTGRYLQQAFDAASESDHSALARCAVVLFNAFALCGDRQESQYWFMKGRDHALKLGDRATIDALQHSKAAFGAAWLRAQNCIETVELKDIVAVRYEISSARNLQNLANVVAHAKYIELCDARLKLIAGEYQEAIRLFVSLRGEGPYPPGHFTDQLLDLEIAFCQSKIGEGVDASTSNAFRNLSWINELDVDDRLGAAWMIQVLSKGSLSWDSVASATDRLATAAADYRSWLAALRKQLAPFSEH